MKFDYVDSSHQTRDVHRKRLNLKFKDFQGRVGRVAVRPSGHSFSPNHHRSIVAGSDEDVYISKIIAITRFLAFHDKTKLEYLADKKNWPTKEEKLHEL